MTEGIYFTAAISLLSGLSIGTAIAILFFRWIRKEQGKVSIQPSTVAGRGAFAAQNITTGEIIERCAAIEVNHTDIGGELLNYVFYGSTENLRLVAMGNGMLFNHSFEPNVGYYLDETPSGKELVLYALSEVRKGEEMFYNYGDDWWATRSGTDS
ncbi:MAG: SET domain-containing protein-lysine N-methyltransferase [Candidatus Chlorobium antarcticum]|jgi:SET domain-containing protein|nr:SET domain-containing protein-lysine N-methyltransferase [Candidatus Chlorobium antarcticum]